MSNHRTSTRIILLALAFTLPALAPLAIIRSADGTGKAFANPERDSLITEVSGS